MLLNLLTRPGGKEVQVKEEDGAVGAEGEEAALVQGEQNDLRLYADDLRIGGVQLLPLRVGADFVAGK